MPDTAINTSESTTTPTAKSLKRTRQDSANGPTNGHSKGTNGENIKKERKNQFGEISDGHMKLGDWVTQWENGRTKFHKSAVHPMLLKHIDRLVEGKDKPRFYLPLCGKSVDLKWLLDRGYAVIGCEIAELGIQQFFEEHDIKYKTEKMTEIEGTVYKGTDDDITIYSCDFFKLTSAIMSKVDCIWDRGSMAAINPEDRQKYSEVIIELMKPDSRYLLDMFQLEHHTFAGPPHNFEPEDAQKLYGTKCTVEHLENVNVMCAWQKTWGTSYFYENDFFITPKSN
ncbi:probable thiopurine S-methyltransferase [Amphiura filiformis]|uniref:probable thiopurine S-methyltransferase n=1 Tax=Amphiura filiformis TaxID=82378 RepID=UPI003B211A52